MIGEARSIADQLRFEEFPREVCQSESGYRRGRDGHERPKQSRMLRSDQSDADYVSYLVQ